RMSGHLKTLLQCVVENPDSPLGSLAILSPEEEQRMLVAWNSNAAELPSETCFQQLFELQVGQTPDAVATVEDDQQVTYQALNGRANILARHLRKAGVGPEVIVALFMQRGIDLLTSILAVFKSGGAYLPLDPANPAQRQFQLLDQSNVSRVVASREPAHVFEDNSGYERELSLYYIEDLSSLEESDDDLPPLSGTGNLAY